MLKQNVCFQMEHNKDDAELKEDPKSWMKWFFVCEKGHGHYLNTKAKLSRLEYKNYIDVIEGPRN